MSNNSINDRFKSLDIWELTVVKSAIRQRLMEFEKYLDDGNSLVLISLKEYQTLCTVYAELEAELQRNRG